jgi:hypothetical protein
MRKVLTWTGLGKPVPGPLSPEIPETAMHPPQSR